MTYKVEVFILLSEYYGQVIEAGSFTQTSRELLTYPVIHTQALDTIYLFTSLHTHKLFVEVDEVDPVGHYLHTTLEVIVVS